MDNKIRFLILALLLTFLTARPVTAKRLCPNCGPTAVPYPLSTGPACGDQAYKIRCSAGTLWLDTLNKSTYEIKSIDPKSQRLIIKPSTLVNQNQNQNRNRCFSTDYPNQGCQLDQHLPFNITGNNYVIVMNCTPEFVLTAPLNCSSDNMCYKYLAGDTRAGEACGGRSCCWFQLGGTMNSYKVYRVREGMCTAYQSFVNLDASRPVSEWPEPGVEIEWRPPGEPVCQNSGDCGEFGRSACLPDPGSVAGVRKCFCRTGFQWDPYIGMCRRAKCRGKRCDRKRRAALIGGLGFAAGMSMVGALIGLTIYWRNESAKREAHALIVKAREDILIANNSGKSAKVFTGKEIVRATTNFSKSNLLGSGGFGEVYRAVLDDGATVAVKRAKLGSTSGTDQILNEVRILCQVSHRNLVRLIGCCVDLDQPVLVYEYVSNGTLSDHLRNPRVALTWTQRLSIARQVADGLAYLHASVVPPIYHRDVKSANILLDDDFGAKVADFGLSRLAVTEATHVSTCAQGTFGYLDPDYYVNFQLTDKSDVYSFGVVLLELLTSEKAVDFTRDEEEVNLVVYAKRLLREERLEDAFDGTMREGANNVELDTMKALGFLASACLDERRQNRPTMKHVTDEIEFIMSIAQTSSMGTRNNT